MAVWNLYRIVEAVGMAVVPVETLRARVVIVKGHDVALVNPHLPESDHAEIAEWLLDHALSSALATRQ